MDAFANTSGAATTRAVSRRDRVLDGLAWKGIAPVATEIGGAIRMPPMMLLRLVDHAIARGIERSRADGRLRVDIETSGAHVRLSVVDSGAGFLPEAGDEPIAKIRSRLAALYGDRGTLMLRRRETNASEAVLDLPVERAEAG